MREGRVVMSAVTVVLWFAVTGGGLLSRVEAPGTQDSRVAHLSAVSFNGCGMIFQGHDFCPRLFRSDGVVYRLDNYGDFFPGQTVTVAGVLDSTCDPGCVDADACIRENTISAGCHPEPVRPSTWGSVKARYR